jgi:hypothetical protein
MAQELTLRIPAVSTSWNIDNQTITITASGVISGASRGRDQEAFKLKLDADLSDLQRNITGLLRSQLDRSEPCGERIAIEHATLAPLDPASLLTVQLHYERWACAKAFGKQIVKKLAGGNGAIQVKLTPAVESNTVRLAPEIGNIEADGSLGELLRSGSFGAMLREKIGAALVSAIQKGADFSATLPPAVRNVATIQAAQFKDAGAGRLALALNGEVRISADEIRLLISQLQEHASTR